MQGESFILYFPVDGILPPMTLSWEYGSDARVLPMDLMRLPI